MVSSAFLKKEVTMKFLIGKGSVSFEFSYENYVISIADYVTTHQKAEPAGNISVMIMSHGRPISNASTLFIAAFIDNRIEGSAWANNRVIDVHLRENDQFMSSLMSALKIFLG
jgi:hypothetical protein